MKKPEASLAFEALGHVSRLREAASERLAKLRRLGGFLRGRLEFGPRPDDIYVVSYPRSGTTWMQVMLLHLVADRTPEFRHLSEASPWFERALALGSARAEDFERWQGPRVFKSHLPYGWLPRPGRHVYVWRDGTDVAVSYFHFYRSHLGFEGDFAAFFARFLTGDLQYCSWFSHVEDWMAHAGRPDTFVVRYEELKTDRAAALERLAHFLGLSLSPARRDQILAATTFEAMKSHEEKFDHVSERPAERARLPSAFIRAGAVGEGQKTLTEAQKLAFEAAWQAARSRRYRLGPPLRLSAFLH